MSPLSRPRAVPCAQRRAARGTRPKGSKDREVAAAQQAMLLDSITESSVERYLNRIFTADVDECSIEELFEAMDLPWDGFESELHYAVSDVLERMENANKVMYREGWIHLI